MSGETSDQSAAPDPVQLVRAGRLQEAEAACRRAMESGENPRAVYLLGVVMAEQGRLGDAIAFFEWATEHLPDDADVAYNFGVICQRANLIERAVREWRRTLEFRPDYPQASYNLAKALVDLGREDEAAAVYRGLLARASGHGDARFNLANIHFRAGRWADAAADYRRLLSAEPGHLKGWINLGMAERRLGDPAAAEAAYRRALALDPGSAEARWNLSHVLLGEGRWAEGFAEFEVRLRLPAMRPPAWPQPQWLGESLAGKRIALVAEQGAGDAIQFLRYAPRVARLAAATVVVCHPALVPLAASVPGVASAHPFEGPLPPFDLFAPLLSLPHRLGVPDPRESWPGPYLRAPETAPLELHAAGSRVGLVWSGNPAFALNHERACPLAALAPLVETPGLACFSLQVGAAADEIARMPFANRLTDLAPHLGDYAATAAVVRQLDLVVSVCTSVAHVAGALGKPVFLMLADPADWRWGRFGAVTPWYPSMRLFRQERPGDWSGVVARVAAAAAAMRP